MEKMSASEMLGHLKKARNIKGFQPLQQQDPPHYEAGLIVSTCVDDLFRLG